MYSTAVKTPGAEPFGDSQVKAVIREVPPQLPPDLYYVPLDVSAYLGSDAPDFAALLFTAPTRVYLLLPSLMREPRWLRDSFAKFRDPASGNHVGVPAAWPMSSGFALLLAAGMKYQAFVRQRFMVWESIKVYGVDEELVLGGPGLAEMGDMLFIVATRSLAAAGQPTAQGYQQSPFPAAQRLAPALQPPAPARSSIVSPAAAGASPFHSFPPQQGQSGSLSGLALQRRASRFFVGADGRLVPAAAAPAVPPPSGPRPGGSGGDITSGPTSPRSSSLSAAIGGGSNSGRSQVGSAAADGTAVVGTSPPVQPSDCKLLPLEFEDAASGRGGGAAGAAGAGATSYSAGPDVGLPSWLVQPHGPPSSLFYRRTGADDGGADGGGADGGGAGSAPVSSLGTAATGVVGAGGGAAWLLHRFIKAVKRDRLQDLRALLESEPWRRYFMSPADVSFLPPTERWPLTVDLAVANVSVPVLVELVDRAGCHLNYRAAKLLMAHWDRLPEHCPGGGEGLLLRYLARHPNPLSVLGACLLAMRAELGSGRNHSAALQLAVSRFKSLQAELLAQLQDSYFRMSEEARFEAGLPLLEEILEAPQTVLSSAPPGSAAAAAAAFMPPGQPLVLSDYSPLRLAFRDHDTNFMSAQLIEGYTRRRWLGPEYFALTALDGHNRLSGLDPMFVYTIVENLGFVGEAGSASLAAAMRMWHLVTMTSPAFFRSPRGRWAMKLMSVVLFLALYQLVLATYTKLLLPAAEGGAAWRALHLFFLVFTGGNLLEGIEVMTMRYQNSAGRYFTSAPGEVLGVLVDVGIFASVAPCLIAAYTDSNWGKHTVATVEGGAAVVLDAYGNVISGGGGGGGGDWTAPVPTLNPAQWMMLRLSLCTLAIFVWMRSLLIMVPLYRKLGPLIRTMTRMGGEILAFVPLYVSVTLGFAAAMHSALGDTLSQHGSFFSSVLTLFEATLGTFDYDIFEELDERRRLYAQILMSIYLVLAAILLTNLLIAIISYKYRPDEVRAESAFDLAEMVDRYRFQVKHHLICSPFNLLLLLFAWLPAAPLPKLPPYEWVKYGMVPLDGLTFATPRFPTTPGGRHEIPHLCYLLTLYPIIIVVSNVLYYLHAPYTVLYWASIGHRKLLKELLGGNGGGGGGATAPDATVRTVSGAPGPPAAAAARAFLNAAGIAGATSAPATADSARTRFSLDAKRWRPGPGPGPVAEKAEREDVEAGQQLRRYRLGAGGGGPSVPNLRTRSMRSMQIYARGDPGSISGRSMSARSDDPNLYDDIADGTAVQPPYMALLRLATLSGLVEAVLSTTRFLLLVVVGTVLYVLVMGLLGGTLGCCLTGWVGSVVVSLYRIVAGAWVGFRAEKEEDQAAAGKGGDGPGGGAAATGSSASVRLAALARRARSRAVRSTYLTRAQVEAAIRNVYTASGIVSMWGSSASQGSVAAAFGGAGGKPLTAVGGGGGAAGAGGGWTAAASKLHLFDRVTSGSALPATAATTGTPPPPLAQRAPPPLAPEAQAEVTDVSDREQEPAPVERASSPAIMRVRSKALVMGGGPATAPAGQDRLPGSGRTRSVTLAGGIGDGGPRPVTGDATRGSLRRISASPAAGPSALAGDSGSLICLPRPPVPRVMSLTAHLERAAPGSSSDRTISGSGASRRSLFASPAATPVAAGAAAAAASTAVAAADDDDERLLAVLRPCAGLDHLPTSAAAGGGHALVSSTADSTSSTPYGNRDAGMFTIPGSIASVSGARMSNPGPAARTEMEAGAAVPVAALWPMAAAGEAAGGGPAMAAELSAMRAQVAALTAVVQQLAAAAAAGLDAMAAGDSGR
ncbi:hypothetical protein GPECTOR_40g513 [Gonium pectorale]|uniref:Polycystin cation channel PKD1/PKD2 domain-containing protein n=1 Tax=Gonium pectorale TaxID=33097 RepID=A0A150GAB4_GONPE|nr:hypothetical protein GPECTOR_40g513 [Gonium pectorale]|eukprot:KXZ46779.1 hypothetical protein GPECTOR_40g513 [Gonium pectorale]